MKTFWLLVLMVVACFGSTACKQESSKSGEVEAIEKPPEPISKPEAVSEEAEAVEDVQRELAAEPMQKAKRGRRRVGAGRGAPMGRPPPPPPHNTEDYAEAKEAGFQLVQSDPLSTFSIDTDTASYSNVRRMLRQGQKPPRGAVRIEELINYFSYSYPAPSGPHPFSASVEAAACPWQPKHQLVRIGLRAKTTPKGTRKPANLVFLLDVSGSMNAANKLPLLKRSLSMAVNQLEARDRVAIVVYAGASGEALPSTPFTDRARILDALNRLEAGGSTNAGQGINLAYDIAKKNFIQGGINRVILATDGDFNVGVTSKSSLVDMVKEKAKEGVFLTVLGFGMGNLKDDMLEKLADNGNGSYAYIDDFAEARKVFGEQIGGTLETVAKDVKLQVEFNPAKVSAYRLIGYENRRLEAKDFKDDKKDAGEIGAGHTVTALYQVVPVGVAIGPDAPKVDDLKYQKTAETTAGASNEWMNVKIRYKAPDADTSTEAQFPVTLGSKAFNQASTEFRFAASVAGLGLILTESENKGELTLKDVEGWAKGALGEDPHGHRKGFLELVDLASKAGTGTQVGTDDCGCPPGDPLCDCL